jgi:hypothetical protein
MVLGATRKISATSARVSKRSASTLDAAIGYFPSLTSKKKRTAHPKLVGNEGTCDWKANASFGRLARFAR